MSKCFTNLFLDQDKDYWTTQIEDMIFQNISKIYCLPLANLLIFIFLILFLLYWTSEINPVIIEKNRITNIVGLILARCGSKGIRMKNIAQFNGKSLLQNSLEVMQEFGKFDDIWVSTDCHEIADHAKQVLPNVRIHWRDSDTATDTASSLMAIKEFSKKHPEIEAIGLIQCTSPFIKKIWLHKAYDMITSQKYDSVFSAVRQHKLLWKLSEGGTMLPFNFDPHNRPRRQDWEGFFIENGMFYFMYVELLKYNLLQGGRIGVVEIPVNYSIEIDTNFDLKLAERMVSILD